MTKYNFREASLPPNFASEKVKEFKELIASCSSACLLSIPGVGVTNFLRFFVSSQSGYYFVFVDAFSLASISKVEFFRQLLTELGRKSDSANEQEILDQCRQALEDLGQKESKIVIVINRLNQLQSILDSRFLANLRWLQIINQDKIILICTSDQPLHRLCPNAITGSNLNIFSKTYYFKPYTEPDMQALVKVGYQNNYLTPEELKQVIADSGGHMQLMQLLLKSDLQNSSPDPFVQLQLDGISNSLARSDKVALTKIAQGKSNVVPPDSLSLGLIKIIDKSGAKIFSPLLQRHLLSRLEANLPALETKLFSVLQQNLGQVVSKDELFEKLWGENWENASDWALNSLIYRLRKKHLPSRGYVIESHKKQGYSLVKT